VLFGVVLCGFFRVVGGVQVMTMRDMGVMAGLFMDPACVVLGHFHARLLCTGGTNLL
jgi:hypothetical protein